MININREEFRNALLSVHSEVYFCNHTLNNSFLHLDVNEVINYMNRAELLPIGICLNPQYGDNNDYGFIFYNMILGVEQWIHISKRIAQSWLKQLGITPPNDIIWNNEVWENYVWEK